MARSAELAGIRFGPRHTDRRSPLPVDVLIPAAAEDWDVLGVTIEWVRRHLAHPVGTIWVVTDTAVESARVAEELGCRVVDEDSVLPIVRTDIDYHVGSVDRSGWLFQQLLKLSADTISSREHVLVIDADTVLVRPQTFTSRGRVVLFHSPEYHPPYFDAYRAATGLAPASRVSCTTHHLLLRRGSLLGLKSLMERTRSVPWWQAVLDTCVYQSISGFAESELYGNYELTVGGVVRRWWSNRPDPRSTLADLDMLQRAGTVTRLRTVSFHHYLSGDPNGAPNGAGQPAPRRLSRTGRSSSSRSRTTSCWRRRNANASSTCCRRAATSVPVWVTSCSRPSMRARTRPSSASTASKRRSVAPATSRRAGVLSVERREGRCSTMMRPG